MSHLNFKQIQDIADGNVEAGMETAVRHVAECPRCAREVAIQRSLARAAKEAPVVKTSAQFTRRVMEAVDPGSRQTWLFRLLGGTGRMFAMLLVLGIVGYSLTLLPTSVGGSEESAISRILSDYYTQAQQTLSQLSGTMDQRVTSQTSTDSSRILFMTIVSIILLAILDRLILRPFLRHRRLQG